MTDVFDEHTSDEVAVLAAECDALCARLAQQTRDHARLVRAGRLLAAARRDASGLCVVAADAMRRELARRGWRPVDPSVPDAWAPSGVAPEAWVSVRVLDDATLADYGARLVELCEAVATVHGEAPAEVLARLLPEVP